MPLIVEGGTALAVRQGRLRPRTAPPRGIIIHTTGAGPWSRYNANKTRFEAPYDAAKYIYERISPYSGHYLVSGDNGSAARLVDTNVRAWHVGAKGRWRYKFRGTGWSKDKGFGWWFTRFPGCNGPRDLLDGLLWSPRSANDLTIGIEVAPPSSGPRDEWSDATWRTLRLLVGNLARRYGIPLDRYHVFTHSDAHPLARTTKSGSPWDPGPRQWTIGRAVQELKLHP